MYFKLQQKFLTGEYGEIFLTNRYGALVATTGKLTTYYHRHKYWWEGAFSGGEGRIFIDDRGFDASVGGSVLGIVIPIQRDNQIIGILKCNIDIISFLNTLLSYSDAIRDEWELQILRSDGRIVLEKDTPPLSTSTDEEIVPKLNMHTKQHSIITHENRDNFYVFAPIKVTMYDSNLLFGGSSESIDHWEGNEGAHWDIMAIAEKSDLYRKSKNLLLLMVYIGFSFFLGIFFIAILVSRRLTLRLRSFVPIVEELGSGSLYVRLPDDSKDEIGTLAKTFNKMVLLHWMSICRIL